MSSSRTNHEVVMMPRDVCYSYGYSTTTEDPDAGAAADEETVALIVGGTLVIDSPEESLQVQLVIRMLERVIFFGHSPHSWIFQSVELFGCPGFGDTSVRLQDFPYPTYLSAGLYRQGMELVTCNKKIV